MSLDHQPPAGAVEPTENVECGRAEQDGIETARMWDKGML